MRILCIHPKSTIWSKSTSFPLGLAYIATVWHRQGAKVKTLDCNITPFQSLPKVDIAAITATTPQINHAWELAQKAQKNGAITILGGPHVTCRPLESISKPQVDYVVIGEGEETAAELYDALRGLKSVSDVPGLYFKVDGKIIQNKLRTFIEDLDKIPFPAYELFPKLALYSHPQPLLGYRRPVGTIMTSRGCPYNCIFCYKGTFGRKWRPRSCGNVIKEWHYLIEQLRVKEVAIQDDLFNASIPRALEICRMIQKENLVTPWTLPNGIRADLLTDELAKEMKASGCYRVAIGVESGNQKMLDTIDKKMSLSTIAKAFDILKRHQLQQVAFFVMGCPGDTIETMEDSMKFCLAVNPTYAQFSIATPFPGTRLEQIMNTDSNDVANDWQTFNQLEPTSTPGRNDRDAQIASRMVRKAYRRFYLRPSWIARFMCSAIFWRIMPRVLQGGWHFLLGHRKLP